MANNSSIEEEEYYHGLLPREDLPYLLQHDGDFLVRISEPKPGSPRQIIISVVIGEAKNNKMMRHIVVQQTSNGKFMTDPRKIFDSVQQLITYFLTTKEPVINTVENAILLNSIKRAPWELKHEQINLVKKLGEGAFGEVYAGTYKMPSGRVVNAAIKLAKVTEMSKEKIKEMMKEARLMRNYDHPNIVRMYGVAVEHEPLLIVMELVISGYKMPMPKCTQNEVAKIISEMCWASNAEQRATMSQVARKLEAICGLEAPNMTIGGNPTPNPCTPAECKRKNKLTEQSDRRIKHSRVPQRVSRLKSKPRQSYPKRVRIKTKPNRRAK
uniref:Tyrosine-protein kinase n=1 Tax=Ascaris lumbricoides TaxID=6252 RepID=A0A0M3I8G2_ASCLU